MTEKTKLTTSMGIEDETYRPPRVFKELSDALPPVKAKSMIDSNRLASFESAYHNNTCSVQEVTDIRRFVLDGSLMISDLDYVLASLSNLRAELAESMRESSRLISAVNRLPVEILTEIFFLVRTRPRPSHPAIVMGFNVSFNAAQVCKRWRDIALGTPRLWSLIHVNGPSALRKGVQGQIDMLSRAAPVFPYLIVDFPEGPSKFLRKFSRGLLSDCRARCKGVDLYDVSADSMKAPSFLYSKVRKQLSRFGQLERLTIIGSHLNVTTAALHTDWRRLTHLRIKIIRTKDVHTFFSVSVLPSLESLVLECSGFRLNPNPLLKKYPNLVDFFVRGRIYWEPKQFSHDRLRRICVRPAKHPADGASLLSAATLPALTELSIPIDGRTEACLKDLFRRSDCHLARLYLTGDHRQLHNGREVANAIGAEHSIPWVEFSIRHGHMQMMRELRARWYERDYVGEVEDEND
ncbi:hypothetical protein CONPUDRAFT_151611 [Coniophora puteana RWD-64-598 SS2]|uniref:F-box domain-containing protein n=1 Tax=Coniophora puteana (strain RWD-64-598) TaxID=741705 RepID=A0A5M3N018_CONPW|nr:uncharacterized protein CONPUDRAFT_151611 [Coniophora puteana RWD-64-598 SS2]EIW84597.1 hypothetical protein CONPUDRAFT_151611 [Coniophora puteana RWD-64-598 SS2]